MPRDFFTALKTFTVLEPIDRKKYPPQPQPPGMAMNTEARAQSAPRGGAPPVRVLEAGVVGNLDYKILEADKPDALFDWMKQNGYSYGGDKQTLDFYISKRWTFTVMKIDPRQLKRNAAQTYNGTISPTRFTFSTPHPVYPLRITQMSVRDRTEAVLYVMARHKMDLAGRWTYETNFLNMWTSALKRAVPQYLTADEKHWMQLVAKRPIQSYGWGTNLLWAGKLTKDRLGVVTGKAAYKRAAPPDDVKKLPLLRGHLKEGWFLTKFRTQFAREEMGEDLAFVRARIWGAYDDVEYVQAIPGSLGDEGGEIWVDDGGGVPIRRPMRPIQR
jgi:hypothetical protein